MTDLTPWNELDSVLTALEAVVDLVAPYHHDDGLENVSRNNLAVLLDLLVSRAKELATRTRKEARCGHTA